MFERFNWRARRVVVLARQSALDLRHNYIGTEHELLGLVLRPQRHVETWACPSALVAATNLGRWPSEE